jgi:hypothetical protein
MRQSSIVNSEYSGTVSHAKKLDGTAIVAAKSNGSLPATFNCNSVCHS